MDALIIFVVIIILIALIFDYINGFHDAANSIATVVSTRVLSPGAAVVWAAFFNFIAFLVLGEAVAKTIGKDMIDIKAVPENWQLWVILCGLIGAIVWNLLTWYYGIPSSSSHALIGGYPGAAAAMSLIGATYGGIPVSTTHTITGAIVGVGATRRLSAVKWGVAGRIVWAWILTIPLAALISAVSFWLYRAVSGLF